MCGVGTNERTSKPDDHDDPQQSRESTSSPPTQVERYTNTREDSKHHGSPDTNVQTSSLTTPDACLVQRFACRRRSRVFGQVELGGVELGNCSAASGMLFLNISPYWGGHFTPLWVGGLRLRPTKVARARRSRDPAHEVPSTRMLPDQ